MSYSPVADPIRLIELPPSDIPAITAVNLIRQNLAPKPFSFEVPSDTVMLGIRLEGTSIVTSHQHGSSHLFQAGDIYMLPQGTYDILCAKSLTNTLFVLAERQGLVGLEQFKKEYQGHIPVASIDLLNDSIMEKVAAICDSSEKQSYFKYNSLLSDMLDKLIRPDEKVLTRYGVPTLDPMFDGLCREVINKPFYSWTTDEAANQCGYSVYHFSRTFRAKANLGFHDFVNRVRAVTTVDIICRTGETSPTKLEALGVSGVRSIANLLRHELGLNLNDIRKILTPRKAVIFNSDLELAYKS